MQLIKSTKKLFVVMLIILSFAACDGVKIIPREYDAILTDEYELPVYRPDPDPAILDRINPEGIALKKVTKYSNGNVDIILSGTIMNGIPEGLIYDVQPTPSASPDTDRAIGESYYRKNSTKKITEPFDFKMEQKAKLKYSAITLKGLVDNVTNIEIKETNGALRLYTDAYIREYYNSLNPLFFSQEPFYKKNNYRNNPNNFFVTNTQEEKPRGGYPFLIYDNPDDLNKTVKFEITYPNRPKPNQKFVTVDYTRVKFRDYKTTDCVLYLQPPGYAPLTQLNPAKPDITISQAGYYSYTHDAMTDPTPISTARPLLMRPVYTTTPDGVTPQYKYREEDFYVDETNTSPELIPFEDYFTVGWNDEEGGMVLAVTPDGESAIADAIASAITPCVLVITIGDENHDIILEDQSTGSGTVEHASGNVNCIEVTIIFN